MTKYSGLPILLTYLVLIAAGQICARQGAIISDASGYGRYNIFHILSYLFLVARGPLWLFVLKKYELSTAFPVLSTSYILILAASALLFGEAVTIGKGAGAALISAGVMLLVSDKLPSAAEGIKP